MRKSNIITLMDDGRQLCFKVTQMPALKQERWINRAILLLAGSTDRVAGLNTLMSKLKAGNYEELLKMFGALKYEDIEPLYDELLECAAHVPDESNTDFTVHLTTKNADTIIGDVRTLYTLRVEALKVNFSFFNQGESRQTLKRAADITIRKTM